MPKHRSSPGGGARTSSGHAQLEAYRDVLLQRLARVPSSLHGRAGYKSAKVLLNVGYLRNKVTNRAAILRAAQFMIGVLELLRPF